LAKRNNVQHYQFPYSKFHGKFYPLIPITLRRGKYSVSTFALLDSGASISVFRPEIARALRLPKSGREGFSLSTADGKIDIGVAKPRAQVGLLPRAEPPVCDRDGRLSDEGHVVSPESSSPGTGAAGGVTATAVRVSVVTGVSARGSRPTCPWPSSAARRAARRRRRF
jgi:hypothetical protein